MISEKARYAARKYGALEWFTDPETMLDKVSPQGVCIVGSPRMHYELGLMILKRGIPIFIEKPPAETFLEVKELSETTEQYNTWGMIGFMKRFAPANLVAKEFMESEKFGRLSSITLIHGFRPL